MRHSHLIVLRHCIRGNFAFVAAVTAAMVLTTARAAEPPAACKPMLEAFAKLYQTPYHGYFSQTRAVSSNKPEMLETIHAANDALYAEHNGKWRHLAATGQKMQEQLQQNIRSAETYSCQYLRSETVNGEAAAVYAGHSETEDSKSDTQIWISASRGLPLRTELDIDLGDAGGKRHSSMRYDYNDVQPPAGVK